MRWNVYGTDASTGQDITLGIEEAEASAAVQSALARRILVSHVTPEARHVLQKTLFPLVCAMVLVLVPLCAVIYANNLSAQSELEFARLDQARLAESMSKAEEMVKELQNNGNLAAGAASQTRKLAEELAQSRARMSMSEQQLTAAHNQLSALERAATMIPTLQQQLESALRDLRQSQDNIARLNSERTLQDRRMHDLEILAGPEGPQAKNVAALSKSNQEFAAQVELLKSQLLVAAIKTPPDLAAAAPEAPEFSPATTRAALRPGYDAAADFARLTLDKDSLLISARSDGTVVSSGAWTANAAVMNFIHDARRDRVYSATLTLPLGPGVPRDKHAENTRLAVEFVKTFAPGLKDTESAIGAAVTELAGKDSRQRIVLSTDDGKVTIWNDRTGIFTLRIEAVRAGGEE